MEQLTEPTLYAAAFVPDHSSRVRALSTPLTATTLTGSITAIWAGHGHNRDFGQKLEDRYVAVASPVSDTDDSGPNFAVRFHMMILIQ